MTLFILLGRTGRFGRQGVAINFISDANSYRWVQELQQDLGVEITAVKTQDYEEMEKVHLAVLFVQRPEKLDFHSCFLLLLRS